MPFPFRDNEIGPEDIPRLTAGGITPQIGQPSGPPSATAYLAAQRAALPASQPDEPVVFVGWESHPGVTRFHGGVIEETAPRTPKVKTITQMMVDFDSWSEERKRAMARKLALGGFFSTRPSQTETLEEFLADQGLGEIEDAYSRLLGVAAGKYAVTNTPITPGQLLAQNIDFNTRGGEQSDGFFAPSGDGSGSQESPLANETRTSTQSSTSRFVDIMDPMDARSLVRATLQRELDRDPTEAEFEDFVAALHQAQRTHPTVTNQRSTTTTVYDELGMAKDTDTDSSTRRRDGITAAGLGEVMLQRAQAQPGWAEWQAVGTYFPALLQELGAVVPGV